MLPVKLPEPSAMQCAAVVEKIEYELHSVSSEIALAAVAHDASKQADFVKASANKKRKRALIVDQQSGSASQLEQCIEELKRSPAAFANDALATGYEWQVTKVATAAEASAAVTPDPFDLLLVSVECYNEQDDQWLQWLSCAGFCSQQHKHAPGLAKLSVTVCKVIMWFCRSV